MRISHELAIETRRPQGGPITRHNPALVQCPDPIQCRRDLQVEGLGGRNSQPGPGARRPEHQEATGPQPQRPWAGLLGQSCSKQ